jgi:hypothetical protein
MFVLDWLGDLGDLFMIKKGDWRGFLAGIQYAIYVSFYVGWRKGGA